jgi:hypothetical protein
MHPPQRDLQDLNDIRYVLNKLYETRNMTFPEVTFPPYFLLSYHGSTLRVLMLCIDRQIIVIQGMKLLAKRAPPLNKKNLTTSSWHLQRRAITIYIVEDILSSRR